MSSNHCRRMITIPHQRPLRQKRSKNAETRKNAQALHAIIPVYFTPPLACTQIRVQKRGLFRKVHFPEILQKLEILEILENPQTVETKENSSSEKTPFVMIPLTSGFCRDKPQNHQAFSVPPQEENHFAPADPNKSEAQT